MFSARTRVAYGSAHLLYVQWRTLYHIASDGQTGDQISRVVTWARDSSLSAACSAALAAVPAVYTPYTAHSDNNTLRSKVRLCPCLAEGAQLISLEVTGNQGTDGSAIAQSLLQDEAIVSTRMAEMPVIESFLWQKGKYLPQNVAAGADDGQVV